ncbi:hypothetical protein GQ457_13G004560 [Hibiscus cannabinus]
MLSGSIPSVSRGFLSLHFIDFGFNNLTGDIPNDMFDHLLNLQELHLNDNMLSGRIPANLFKCNQLQVLFLTDNQLEGSIPAEIGNLSMLQIFSIGYNHFEGEIPKEIGNLTLLYAIECEVNNLTGIIPYQIGNLKNLGYLNLQVNNIAGSIPPQVFNISTLRTFSLASNRLSGHLPSNMGLWLSNLEELHLGGNQLIGPIPISISNATKLTILDMSSNYFSGSVPDNLGNLRNLLKLNLLGTNLTSLGMSFLSSLTNCKGLQFLAFNNNPLISGELPGLVGNLSGSLQQLYASGCNIRGSIPSEIGNLSGLINIQLGDNKLTGTIPTTIGALKELQSLSLQDNRLEGYIPSELCNLNNLAFLLLTSNKLSGPIPACLGNLISLRNLFLGSNMFSSSIPSTLTGLNDLLILDLSSNSLNGTLPIDIGKWKVLISMDLSNNQFSSDIPTGVADLEDLVTFSLSNNRITGSIPESFGDLLSLEFLDLSKNNLSGEIPKSLENLHYLKYFNVSFNRLQGKIPQGGLFGSYSIESFEGNKALCGAPQLHIPSCKSVRNSKARTKIITYATMPVASTILVVALVIIILQRRKRKNKLPTEEDLLPLGTWRRFSCHELHQATDGFSQNKLLGNGSYGSVYQGNLSDRMVFAVKVFKLELEGAFKSFDVECEVLRNTRHRNLIKIISSCSNDFDFKALVLEFMPNGSLDKWLYSNYSSLDILQRLNIMIDVASALKYLHHSNVTPVVHCDLKPSNVLLDEDMVAHLSDFGIAKLLCKEDSVIQTMTIATFGYMAPEYGIEGIVSIKGDVYSFGILMMEIITRKKPTDEMFTEEKSLKSWVKESISSPLNQILDTHLLSISGSRQSSDPVNRELKFFFSPLLSLSFRASKCSVIVLMAPPEIHVLSADEEQVLETQTFANKRVNVCLNETNYLLWKQQVVLTIKGLRLEGFMDGYVPVPSKIARNRGGEEVSNPLYLQYIKQDSSLASWLLSTISPHILPQLVGSETTAGIWKTITDKLRSMKKGTQSVTEYAMVIKQTCDLLASCGNPISKIEHIATILNGLPIEFEPSIAANTASKESYSVDNIVSVLVDAKTRMEGSTRFPIGINYTKYNGKHVANNGEESVVDSQDSSRSTVNHAGRYKGRTRPQCQLCGKLGHLVDRCWHRFDQSYKGVSLQSRQSQSSSSAQVNTCSCCTHTPAEPTYAPFVSQGVQEVEPDEDAQVNLLMVDGPTAYSKWFPDSGATHHVTSNITNISFLSSNDKSLYLDKVLFVPQITNNLMSVAKCTKDNNVFFEFHSNVCYIKDSNSKKSNSVPIIPGDILPCTNLSGDCVQEASECALQDQANVEGPDHVQEASEGAHQEVQVSEEQSIEAGDHSTAQAAESHVETTSHSAIQEEASQSAIQEENVESAVESQVQEGASSSGLFMNTHPMVTRRKNGIVKPKIFNLQVKKVVFCQESSRICSRGFGR